MAIGNQNTVASVNTNAGQLAVRWKRLADDLAQFTAPVLPLSVADLQALGFTFADATAMVALVIQMDNLAQVYYGTMAQAPAFNYSNSFLPLRGTE